MKKNAVTLIELLIAMGLMMAIAVLTVNTFFANTGRDTDIMKFRHLYGSLTKVIFELRNDYIMYPGARGFANVDTKKYYGEEIEYGGKGKFKKLFKSKFNIFENDIEIKLCDNEIPLTKYYFEDPSKHYNSEDEKYKYYTSANGKVKCFTENKGFLLCPPDTFNDTNTASINQTKDTILSIYVPVFVNKIDFNKPASTAIENAIFVQIDKDGKISIPSIVENNTTKIIDCHKKDYNSYNHCKVIEKILDINF